MIISPSLPFQFWQNGETFNQKQICGVHSECYCAPWICDKEIVLQVKDYIEGQEVTLRIKDENDLVLHELPFDAIVIDDITDIEPALQFENQFMNTDLSSWNNFNGSDRASALSFTHFSVGATGWALVDADPGVDTKYFATARPDNPDLGWPPGDYVISIKARNSSTDAGTMSAQIWGMQNSTSQTLLDNASADWPQDNTYYTRQFVFTLSEYTKYLAFTFTKSVFLTDFILSVDEITIDSAPTQDVVYGRTVYNLAFTPSQLSPELCDKKVVFELISSEAQAFIPTTDCIDIRTAHDNCLTEIIYTNTKNFDGIEYEVGSPPPVFTKLIAGQFWKEDNPQEQEDSVLSNGVIVTRRSEIQEKTLLEIGFVPNYEHKKIQKILMHNSVQIEDVNGDLTYWKKRDAYESENSNRYPLKKGQVWLTKYNSVEKNTI
jgi:hypothetical protein